MEESSGQKPADRYRFGVFEADAARGELRRQGIRVKLNTQPFQVLLMLLERPGELLTREEISRRLWPDGTFVDFEHGVNSAVNRIREALGDTAGSPRFVETVARRGYRFVAPIEHIAPAEDLQPGSSSPISNELTEPEPTLGKHVLATTHELPKVPYAVAQTLFILFQLMYLGFYVGALANLAEIDDLLSPLPKSAWIFNILIVTAAMLIPVRAFLLSAVIFHAPRIRLKFLKLWPFLLVPDVLWSLSPFLLLHHINVGMALACATLLVYSPFAQRSLVLMGAGTGRAPSKSIDPIS
ncbi:Transcriptional regulator, CadC [Candidatus Sulfotelmatomonas gaucii]|uniref:Transcriptional regulator, CadC n=1 Tax=Candidatus Sulfuritelmatomonas gaucii TaxID=2043161 RepID=A0A2N9LA88_9BACT|nr:Transcriptional regulator, CadC [Candidatus Sulfotelmatomonas gaucii]